MLLERPVMVKPIGLSHPFNGSERRTLFLYFIGHQTNHILALFYGGNAEAVGPLRLDA